MDEYLVANRASWDERAPAHAASPDYGFDRFASHRSHLSPTVRFDLPRLGEVAGLDGVHLQCHLGTDTVSLARLGARMTGLDFSAPAVDEGRRLAASTGLHVPFVEAGVYDALGDRSASVGSVERWPRCHWATTLPNGGPRYVRGTTCLGSMSWEA